MSRFVAYAALCRALLLGRLVLTLAAVGVGLGIVEQPRRAVVTLVVIAVVSVAQVAVLTRWPVVIRWRLAVLVVDAAVMVGVLLLDRGGVAFFCYAAGFAALSGALLGTRSLPLWLADAGLGLAVATEHLRAAGAETAGSVAAPFLLAFPMVDIVCGFGAAIMTAALARYIDASVTAVTAAHHSAAASERARLAREMHDSVAKTLRGVSFAAVALPAVLRRQPDLAEQLATTVSAGADTAIREARELLAALRRDVPDQPFAELVARVCDTWSASAGVPVAVAAGAVEPLPSVRYELSQILHEALDNVGRHADATRVEVELRQAGGWVELTVRDDGGGFAMPADLTALSTEGRFGVIGMSERAQAAGGELRVESEVGAGTAVLARVPLSTPDALAVPAGRAAR